MGKEEGEKIWTLLPGLPNSAVSPDDHKIVLQTPEALGLFQHWRDFPELDSDLENFKTLIPIKPDSGKESLKVFQNGGGR